MRSATPLGLSLLAALQLDTSGATRPARRRESWNEAPTLRSVLLSLFSEKGGDIASQYDWTNKTAGRTVWRYEQQAQYVAKVLPSLRRVLREVGTDVNAPHEPGAVTALHLAAFIGQPSLVSLLLSAGARPDALSEAGRTPLDEAMYSGNVEALQLLLVATPSHAQPAARQRIARYLGLRDSALRGQPGLSSSLGGLPTVTPRAPIIDARPHDGTRASCDEFGGWGEPGAGVPPPVGTSDALVDDGDHSDVDQRVGLSAAQFHDEYFLQNRPVVIRNAVPLRERCALSANSPHFRSSLGRTFRCGATAYPALTGREACGEFSFIGLRSNPVCADERGTRPLCNWKLGRVSKKGAVGHAVNHTPGFIFLPARLRHPDVVPPLPEMNLGWGRSTSRALWGGTAWSGSGFHYHNPAYNVLFFGEKKWVLTPPRHAGVSDVDSVGWPDAAARAKLPAGLPLRFTQRAGDVVVVPAQWGHSTISARSFTLGYGVLWCDRRWLNFSGGSCHLYNNVFFDEKGERVTARDTGREGGSRKRVEKMRASHGGRKGHPGGHQWAFEASRPSSGIERLVEDSSYSVN